MSLPADQRPYDDTPIHTSELPATPVRDRNIPAEAWIEAPEALSRAGDDIGHPRIAYKRRLGPWLLWRAGPARGAEARYVAVHADDTTRVCTFRLHADGSGEGRGPDGRLHRRFRDWKRSLVAPGRPGHRAGSAPVGGGMTRAAGGVDRRWSASTGRRGAEQDQGGGDVGDESLIEVLAGAERRGYRTDIDAHPDGRVHCRACDAHHDAARLVVHDHVRLEGASDPSDLQLVVFARCPSCGAQGRLVLGYGPNASPVDAEVEGRLRLPRSTRQPGGG